jgi:hypothetical protein
VSRGGTKKARAAQARRLKERERKQTREAGKARKQAKKERPKHGRGRAALVHLSGVFAPLAFSILFLLSGSIQREGESTEYWLSGLVADPNAPYWREPAGLVQMSLAFILVIVMFWGIPVGVWRAVYRHKPMIDRDWSSVDGSFTILAVAASAWIIRGLVGFNEQIEGFAFTLVLLSVYIPVFSALLALIMPVIPKSGRIGGVLPNIMRVPFTERVLMTDEERAEAEESKALLKVARQAARQR